MTRSNFYGSTQSRLKTYTKDRRVEERNGDIHQTKVYAKLALDRGDIEQADRITKLGEMVINKIGSSLVNTTQPQLVATKTGGVMTAPKFDIRTILGNAISQGKLSQLWTALKSIHVNKTNVHGIPLVILDDIKKNTMLQTQLNELLAKNADAIAQIRSKEGHAQKFQNVLENIPIRKVLDDMVQLIAGSYENASTLAPVFKQVVEENPDLATLTPASLQSREQEFVTTKKPKGSSSISGSEASTYAATDAGAMISQKQEAAELYERYLLDLEIAITDNKKDDIKQALSSIQTLKNKPTYGSTLSLQLYEPMLKALAFKGTRYYPSELRLTVKSMIKANTNIYGLREGNGKTIKAIWGIK